MKIRHKKLHIVIDAEIVHQPTEVETPMGVQVCEVGDAIVPVQNQFTIIRASRLARTYEPLEM